MNEEFEKIGEVSETRTLTVSQKGEGLALYLPKGFVALYDLMAGDRIKVKLMEVFRPKRDEGE